jgi:hypothetical protein
MTTSRTPFATVTNGARTSLRVMVGDREGDADQQQQADDRAEADGQPFGQGDRRLHPRHAAPVAAFAGLLGAVLPLLESLPVPGGHR